jgi:hypothetical protein
MRSALLLALLLAGIFLVPGPLVAQGPREPTFEKDIVPIFQARCWKCHGADKQKGDLDLRSKAALLSRGENGPAPIFPSPPPSLLWALVSADKMPPGKEKLSIKEKVVIKTWLDAGAPAASRTAETGTFWSFRPPVRPPIPLVHNARQVRNPIDAFLLAELEKKGLGFSPEAERATLLRRVYLDLTGLPPSPQEATAFLADGAPDAYERVLEQLLASPRYGERWARHWLDLAGYADSEGILDADYVRSAAWRYRDYVIRAFNSNKPYQRFLQEQIAGDELVDYWGAYRTEKTLPPHVVEALTATGYLRCASDTSRPDFVNIKNAPGYYYQTLDDTLKIVGSGVLGLTLECAKCHNHKYDPIPQAEYYRLQAVFMSAYRPAQWVPQVQRRLLEATAAQEQEAKEHNAKVDAVLAGVRKELDLLRQQYGERLFVERLARLPEAIRADVRAALAAPQDKRSEVQKYLADKFQKELRPELKTLLKLLADGYPDYRTKAQELDARLKAEEAKRRTFPEIRALYDLPGEPKTPLLRRGDYTNPGPEVQPGTLSVLAAARPFAWKSPAKDAKTSGRRLAFAEWLTQPDHPLTARVLVNRLWLHHFGEGLVATPENFGTKGTPPSHPELLDWLACEFGARNGSLKAMHRLMLTSTAYRQSSTGASSSQAKAIDPENRLLWRQRLHRIEAEVLRDSVLSVAGSLNEERYGPPVPVQRSGAEVVASAGAAGLRRSIYLQVRRSQPLTLLQAFDQPVMETNCSRRGVSTVASQALALLNSDFLVQQAEAFAGRVLREAPAQTAEHAVRLAFCRPATAEERTRLTEFLTAQAARHASAGVTTDEAGRRALADLCQMLLSANEFAYVD